MRLGENVGMSVDAISTGSIMLDAALGIGGLPREGLLKSTGRRRRERPPGFARDCRGAETGRGGGVIDAEHALDPEYSSALGVDIDSLLVSQPDTGEQALEIAEAPIRSGAIDVVVIDSVAALVPRAEIEGEMGPPRRSAGV